MKTKRMNAFFITAVMLIECTAMGTVPLSAQTVSENTATAQESAEVVTQECEANNDSTEAATIVYSGKDGDLDWSIDSNWHLTISGNGDYTQKNLGSINGWSEYAGAIKTAKVDVSGITSTAFMFEGCLELTALDICGLDTSQVTDMTCMFCDCENLRSIDVSKFDTSKVTNMNRMYGGCTNLTSLDVSKWNTSKVTNMGRMFEGCRSLISLDVSAWNTSNVTRMSSVFNGCRSLTSLDVSAWNTSNAETMSSMFRNCTIITSLDVSAWDTSKVTRISEMFWGCSEIANLDISKWNTQKLEVLNIDEDGKQSIFDGCTKLTQIDAPEFADNLDIFLPEISSTVWKYQPTEEIINKITKAGKYIRENETNIDEDNGSGSSSVGTEIEEISPPITKPATTGTVLSAENITETTLPASATFTVTSNDTQNPTVVFNGVADENAPAVTIPANITCNGVTYKVTSVAVTSFTKTKENAKFKVTSNQVGDLTVQYTAPANKKKTSITIPQYTTYKGIKFKVTSIAPKAFKNNKKIKKVTISASITTIGKEAFRNCKNLKKITIKSKTLKSIGKNALKGINKKCKIKVPKTKLKAYKKLFNKKGQAKSVKITK